MAVGPWLAVSDWLASGDCSGGTDVDELYGGASVTDYYADGAVAYDVNYSAGIAVVVAGWWSCCWGRVCG